MLDMMLPTALSSRLPRFVQRLLRIGPRHGIARGLTVYGSPGTRDGAIGAATAVLQPGNTDTVAGRPERASRIHL